MKFYSLTDSIIINSNLNECEPADFLRLVSLYRNPALLARLFSDPDSGIGKYLVRLLTDSQGLTPSSAAIALTLRSYNDIVRSAAEKSSNSDELEDVDEIGHTLQTLESQRLFPQALMPYLAAIIERRFSMRQKM